MAEINVTTSEMESQGIMIPKIKKPSFKKEKKVFLSDVGLMTSFNTEKSLKLRINGAYKWDDEQEYPASDGGTPLHYLESRLADKIVQLNDSDDEIKITEFFKVKNQNDDLVALELGVTPAEKIAVVQEAIDFLMCDENEGMGCEKHPTFRANVHINRERFVKNNEETVPLKLGNFFGVIVFEEGFRPRVKYDWQNVPYTVNAKFTEEETKAIEIRRMRGGNTGFFLPVEFRDHFEVISFNRLDDGRWEFHSTRCDSHAEVNKFYYMANSIDFVDAVEELPCALFENVKNPEVVKQVLCNLIKSTEEALAGKTTSSDFLNVYSDDGEKKMKKSKKEKKAATDTETFTIAEAVATDDDEEENEFN